LLTRLSNQILSEYIKHLPLEGAFFMHCKIGNYEYELLINKHKWTIYILKFISQIEVDIEFVSMVTPTKIKSQWSQT
jgi:hypothetical protein